MGERRRPEPITPVDWTDVSSALLGLGRPDLLFEVRGAEAGAGESRALELLTRYRDTVDALFFLSQAGYSHEPITLPKDQYHEPIDVPHLMGLGVDVPGVGEHRPIEQHYRAVSEGMVGLYDNYQAHLDTIPSSQPQSSGKTSHQC